MVLTSFNFIICLLICFKLSQQNLTCSFSSFPFMIGIKETFSFRHVCAGSLVKPDTVLTLASCIIGRKEIPGYFTAVAGPSLIGKIGSQRSIAKEIVIHAGFDRTRYAFDVGLLILQHKFQLSHLINIVKVPEEFIAEDFGKLYTKAVAIGWGPYHPGKRIIDDNRYLFNPSLKCVELDLLDEKTVRS
ncbi:hypothetical protein WA026_017854 [Henosepilachna vigintioctopunctata]|uniref:Peptidase S1 domain-containing protein n=1 Tax=Henosepilachna vigintioctopunctata TaxID=420089 RepID=A0AAW1TLV1_9CUCU